MDLEPSLRQMAGLWRSDSVRPCGVAWLVSVAQGVRGGRFGGLSSGVYINSVTEMRVCGREPYPCGLQPCIVSFTIIEYSRLMVIDNLILNGG